MEKLCYSHFCLYSSILVSKVTQLILIFSLQSGETKSNTVVYSFYSHLWWGDVTPKNYITWSWTGMQSPLQNEKNAETNSPSSMTSFADFTAVLIDRWTCFAYLNYSEKKRVLTTKDNTLGHTVWFLCGPVWRKVNDSYGSLLTQDILWFCDSKILPCLEVYPKVHYLLKYCADQKH